MDQPFLTQTTDALFPKILWNRPITKGAAGRLLLIGGHQRDFQLVQAIYQYAVASGIGQTTTVLPDSLRPLLQGFDDTYFVASSPSGSIGKAAAGELLHLAADYDALSIGANLSNNSETAVAIERIITETSKPAILYLDAFDALSFNLRLATDRDNCVIIVTMPQLFKLAGKLGVALQIKPERELLGRVEIIEQVASEINASLVCVGRELIVASESKISVTPDISARINPAIYGIISVFWTWRHSFEALTTGAYIIRQVSQAVQNEDKITNSHITKSIEMAMLTDQF